MKTHIIRKPEYLTKLAKAHGFDAEAVWNEPKNKKLKDLRCDRILYPGDLIHLPEPQREWLPLRTQSLNEYKAFNWPPVLPAQDITPWDAVYLFYDPLRMPFWRIGCALFVQIVHLRALALTLGYSAFNLRIGSPFLFRLHGSTGIKTTAVYNQPTGTRYEMYKVEGNSVVLVTDRTPYMILSDAPCGSRVCFCNPGDISNQAYLNENTIKMGPDLYAAHGLGKSKKLFSEEELRHEICTAGGGDYIKNDTTAEKKEAMRREIYVNWIEHYEQPGPASTYMHWIEDSVEMLANLSFGNVIVERDGSFSPGLDAYDCLVWEEVIGPPGIEWLRMKE